MTYTNTGLVEHAKKALNDKTMYMWGGIYRLITQTYIKQLSNIYGRTRYSSSRLTKLNAVVGRGYYGVDCVGLIKSYYWSGAENGGRNSKYYGLAGYPDVNANDMFAAASVRGPISTLPEVPGTILFCKSNVHVGIYIGDGWVIESTLSGRGDGVVKTRVSAFNWEYWFYCPYITYNVKSKSDNESGSENKTDTALKIGDKVTVSTACKTTYNGGSLSSKYVANGRTAFTVMEIRQSRVVIGINGAVTAAVDAKYLKKI